MICLQKIVVTGSMSELLAQDLAMWNELQALDSALQVPAPYMYIQTPRSNQSEAQCVIQGKTTGNLNSGTQGALPGIIVEPGNVAIDPRVLGLPGGQPSTNQVLSQYGAQITITFSPSPELPHGFPNTFTVGDVVGPASARAENPPIFDINGLPNLQAAYNVTGLRMVTITFPATAPLACGGSSGGSG